MVVGSCAAAVVIVRLPFLVLDITFSIRSEMIVPNEPDKKYVLCSTVLYVDCPKLVGELGARAELQDRCKNQKMRLWRNIHLIGRNDLSGIQSKRDPQPATLPYGCEQPPETVFSKEPTNTLSSLIK